MISSNSTLALLFLCSILIIGCASPQKALNNGNYDKAYKQALKELERGKNMTKNRSVVAKSLDNIIQEQMSISSNLKSSQDLRDIEESIKILQGLQGKIDESSIFLRDKFEMEDELLQSEKENLKTMVAREYFSRGLDYYDEAFGKKDKLAAQDAYYSFDKAAFYEYEDPDLAGLIEKSFDYGQVIYLVDANAPFDITYNWEIDRVFDDVENIDRPFKKFIYENSTAATEIDCEINIRFDDINLGIRERDNEQRYTRDIVIGTEEVTNSDGTKSEIDIIETVEVLVYTKEVTKIAEWGLRLDVRSNGNNCTISDRIFQETITAVIEDVSVSGDQRALPGGIREGSNGRLPSDNELAEELLNILYEEIENHLERR